MKDRKAPRFDIALDADLGVFETQLTATTTNISRFGLHIDAEPAANAGDLVWMRLALPDGHIIEATAITRPRKRDTPGCGLAFSVFLHGSRRYWERYIATLEQGERGEADERRTFRRALTSVVVRIGDTRYESLDLSAGGVYVRMDASTVADAGEAIELVFVDPASEATISVLGRPLRDDNQGIAFEFVEVDEPTRTRLRAFVYGE
ncbi:MAG: PilZ domain-containing protein [Proteobacteria bacterium]|nr:PilZ domain-containing protein [Pseudomonadota bacterium]